MSIRGNGRWLLLICGAGVIAALATAAVSWKDIVVHYHLERLRQDPASLPSFLDASAGATKKLAARAFARERQGRMSVVSLFVDYFAKAHARPTGLVANLVSRDLDIMDLGEVDKAIVGFYGWVEVAGELMFWGELRWRLGAFETGRFFFSDDPVLVTCAGRSVFIDATRIVALAELLLECRGVSLDLPDYPGLTVEVLSIESALDRVKTWTEPLTGSPVTGVLTDGSIPPRSSALLLTRVVP